MGAAGEILAANGMSGNLVNNGKTIGRYSLPAGMIIGVAQIGYGYSRDGNHFGYNTQKATAGFVGGTLGAWAGFKVGAWAGFEAGFSIGLCFEGVGAIPGAIIGGVVGGFVGAFGGAWGGDKLGESLITNKAQ